MVLVYQQEGSGSTKNVHPKVGDDYIAVGVFGAIEDVFWSEELGVSGCIWKLWDGIHT